MNTPFLFITGMFRSGTTLLGRMLHAHPQIAIASDPFLDFFKQFRSAVAKSAGLTVPSEESLGDYYFSTAQSRLLATILDSDLSLLFPERDFGALTDLIKSRGATYSPLICERLDARIQGARFKDVFDSLLAALQEAYGRREACFIGCKEVWANEFAPALASSYPSARFIQIIRDPRAVCASKNSTQACYPWLFLGRQWRKLAALSWLNQHNPAFSERVLTLHYEDLITHPVDTAQGICRFLQLDYSPDMVNPSGFVDGKGQPWLQNSNYQQTASADFDTGALQRWKSVLSTGEQDLIKYLCWPEMNLHGYHEKKPSPSCESNLLLFCPLISHDRLADWIRTESLTEPLGITLQLSHEMIRYRLLTLNQDMFEKVDDELVQSCFLNTKIANKLREVCREINQ